MNEMYDCKPRTQYNRVINDYELANGNSGDAVRPRTKPFFNYYYSQKVSIPRIRMCVRVVSGYEATSWAGRRGELQQSAEGREERWRRADRETSREHKL